MERAREDLAVIRQLMEETRREVVDGGRHFVIWGLVATVGLVSTYLAALGRPLLDPRWVWVGLLAVGWTASVVVGLRDDRRARVRTAGRRILSVVWVSVAVTMTLIGVAGMFGEVVSDRSLAGLLSVVIAAPVLVTAQLTGERWLMAVAAGWWLGGGVMLFVPGLYALPLMASMALLLLAVPGLVLGARSRGSGAGGPVTEAA